MSHTAVLQTVELQNLTVTQNSRMSCWDLLSGVPAAVNSCCQSSCMVLVLSPHLMCTLETRCYSAVIMTRAVKEEQQSIRDTDSNLHIKFTIWTLWIVIFIVHELVRIQSPFLLDNPKAKLKTQWVEYWSTLQHTLNMKYENNT